MGFWRDLFLGMIPALFALPSDAFGEETWNYGGFLESTAKLFASRPRPADAQALGIGQAHLWIRVPIGPKVSWRSSWDFRLDTHQDVDRGRWVDLSQRGLRQPAGALKECFLDLRLGRFDLRLGKQEIRWGRADGFNPTDNLLPFDYIDLSSEQRIPVPAIKAEAYLGRARLEAVWIPFFTPTRLPLLNQRWFPRLPLSTEIPGPSGAVIEVALSYREGKVVFPARTLENGQWGFRWNQVVPRGEFSLSYFNGFDDIPFFSPHTPILPENEPDQRAVVSLNRAYYPVRVLGADFASGLGPFGTRGEIAFFNQTDPNDVDRIVFVVGLDRTWGDWLAIVQYTDQWQANTRTAMVVFPDQGLRSAVLYRIERALDSSRSIEIRGAFRVRDGDFLIQPLYNIALTDRWRLKIGATVIGGPASSYLGQYRDNGYLNLQLRYTF